MQFDTVWRGRLSCAGDAYMTDQSKLSGKDYLTDEFWWSSLPPLPSPIQVKILESIERLEKELDDLAGVVDVTVKDVSKP